MGFRYLDATDRQAVAKQVVKHELQRQAQALEHQEQAIKRRDVRLKGARRRMRAPEW